MTTWVRAKRSQLCGRCSAEISIGDPVLVIAFDGLVKIRCAACEVPPVDLPPLADDWFTAVPLRLPAMMQRAINLTDYKARQAKDE